MNFLMSSEMILLVSYSSMIIKQWYAISYVEVFETIFILLMHVLFFLLKTQLQQDAYPCLLLIKCFFRVDTKNRAEVGKPWPRDQIWSACFCMPSNRNALHILQLFYSIICTSLTDYRSPSIYCKYPYTHGLMWGFSFLLY